MKHPVRAGLAEGLFGPGLGTFAAMVGFGSLAGDGGTPLWAAIALTVGVWSMPGQVAFVDLHAAGAPLLVVLVVVTVANVRMFPLTIATIPLLRARTGARPEQLALAQLNSVTSYVRVSDLAEREHALPARLRFFTAFTAGTLVVGTLGTVTGFTLAGALPPAGVQALIFVPRSTCCCSRRAAPSGGCSSPWWPAACWCPRSTRGSAGSASSPAAWRRARSRSSPRRDESAMPEATTLAMVAAAILGTFAWRAAGVLVAGRMDTDSALFAWVTCVAYAIAAGLMMKLLVFPTGVLAGTSLADRAAAFAAAAAVFYLSRRRLVPALAVGVLLFFALLSRGGPR